MQQGKVNHWANTPEHPGADKKRDQNAAVES